MMKTFLITFYDRQTPTTMINLKNALSAANAYLIDIL